MAFSSLSLLNFFPKVQIFKKINHNQIFMSGIRFGADSFSTYEEGIKKEWIVGNGLGDMPPLQS
jgi:hypothetical protein